MNEDLTPPPLDVEELRRRQRARARITGLALVGMAVLFYLITIAKIGSQ